MNLYTSIFKRSKVIAVNRAQGKVMSVTFELEGQHFMGLNAGPAYKFNEAVSFFVGCDTQQEIDELWGKLTRRRRLAEPLRLAQGQVRLVMADRPQFARQHAERSRWRQGRPGDERDDADGQARSREVATGV